jgi:hypothetical protein
MEQQMVYQGLWYDSSMARHTGHCHDKLVTTTTTVGDSGGQSGLDAAVKED